ncbi:MAG: selenocysteine-specific translation elongation factor, partial [Dehalococcoidia bacterium]
MYVIGTAGHVDHGKSALVQALTGIDPDRLREEKERGLTIDLGFAWLRLPGGQEISIVDVPGHERFIKNMLAGVGGIDLALLVIAADESVMPQTREHLAIIDLLDISHGVVAITKADLVEPDFLELVQADAEELLEGTALAGAPIIPCSAVTRQGLDELLAAIESELARTPAKRDIGRPRLPIDRAFTITGFGTVVTGTLIDGTLQVGQEVEIMPGGLRTRIRGLQAHTQKVDIAPPGRRTAVNLTGLAVEKLKRGMVVTTPGWLEPTTALDVHLRAVRYLDRPIRHNLSVTVHTGSAEVPGRLLLLDNDSLPPGQQAWAQLRLSEPVAVVKGDRFILRDPNDTLGGGRIVDTHVRRHRRFHQPTLDALETLASGSPEELVSIALARAEPAERRELLRRVELDPDAAREAIERLTATGEILALDPAPIADNSLLCTAQGFQALADRLQDILATYHRQFPLRRGIPREELRSRLQLESRPFDQTLALCARRGEAIDVTGAVALPGHQPRPNPEQEARAQACLASLREQPFTPPTDNLPEEPILAYLEDRGDIVRLGGGIAFAAEPYSQMVERIVSHLRQHRTITLAQVRDLFGTSRKYAQALLEHMDDQRITRRRGDER